MTYVQIVIIFNFSTVRLLPCILRFWRDFFIDVLFFPTLTPFIVLLVMAAASRSLWCFVSSASGLVITCRPTSRPLSRIEACYYVQPLLSACNIIISRWPTFSVSNSNLFMFSFGFQHRDEAHCRIITCSLLRIKTTNVGRL